MAQSHNSFNVTCILCTHFKVKTSKAPNQPIFKPVSGAADLLSLAPMKTSIVFPYSLRKSALSTLCALILTACAGTTNNTSGPVPDGYYRVQRGDNLYRIGLRFDQSVQTLAAWNKLSDPTQIEVGQVLRVRAKAGTTSRPAIRSTADGNAVAATNRINLIWPVNGNIVKNYNGSSSKGIDIAAARGTPVQAAADGTVLYAGDGVRGYGNLVLIRHSSTALTAYAYNDNLKVSKNQKVNAGQTIASVGDSGLQDGEPKLHFELRINGKAVDPMPYLQK